jgi:hypothetical protein
MVIVLFSPQGGAGRTTIATNLAVALHQSSKKPVVLVDGSLPLGDIAVALNVSPKAKTAYYPKHLREDPSCGACRAVNGGVVRVTSELPLMPTGFDHGRPLTEPWTSMRRFKAYQVEAGPEGGKVPGFVRLMWRFAKFPVFERELGEET